MTPRHPTFILIVLSVCQLTLQSPSLFSLQPAVEALNDREAQLALRNEIENGNLEDFIDNDDFEWSSNSNDYDERGRGKQRVPARYLARTDYDEDDYRKRAMSRKRDASVFRERARLPTQQHGREQQAELAERFLKAIEEEREREREEEYREELRNLWSRYQKEESNIERELFNDENDIESDYPLSYEDDRKKKKRQGGEIEKAPYWNDSKRTMLNLPWLPAQRKKRFPVTKRSPKPLEMARAVAETSDKVAKDLQGIFGNIADNNKSNNNNKIDAGVVEEEEEKKKKRKRSSDGMMIHQSQSPDKSQETKVEAEQKQSPSASVNDDKKRNVKRSAPNDDSEEEDTDNDNEDDEGTDYDGAPEYSDSSEEDAKRKKKKREAKSLENGESIHEKKISIGKKSIDWSNFFGIDRKKRSEGMLMHKGLGMGHHKKRGYWSSEEEYEDEGEEEDDEPVEYVDDRRQRKKRSQKRGENKLDAMDRKLKTIENLIVEDTAKYYEHNNENLSPSEMKEMRSQLADRLATAYSIEKMRKAIGRLKQSIAFQRGLEQNLLEKGADDDADDADDDKKKKAKRVAIKKEKAEFDNNDHEIDSPHKKVSNDDGKKSDLGGDDNDDDDDKKKKKKKRSQKKSSNALNEEPPMNEGNMGGGGSAPFFQSECPILDSIEKRCRGIDMLSGAHQNLLEACGEHQLCYLCGNSEPQCDYKYLYDAKEVCGYNAKCKMNAAQALDLLRRASGNKVGPRECIRNPCLNAALRSIGY